MTTIHHPRILATALSLATLCVAAGCTDHAALDDLAADASHGSSSDTTSTSTTSTSTHDSDTSDPSTSDTSPMTSSETGAPAECPANRTCVPAVDSGWAGPLVARENDGELQLSCEAPFADHFATLHAGFVAPPPTCGCECEAEGNPGCDPVSGLEQFEANVCAGPSDDWFVSSACNAAVAAAPGTSLSADEIEVTGVSCEPSPTAIVPPATFARTIMMCAPPSAPVVACGDAGECAPTSDPDVEQLCIVREGDEACPRRAWDAQRHVYHRDYEDDRACTDCSCTEFSGTCSGATIVVFNSNDCSGAPVGGVSPGSCDQLGNQGASSGRRNGVAVPDVDCSGNSVGGDPIGSAKATNPFTVCCLSQLQ